MLIRTAKRVAIAVIGGTVVLIGLTLIVLPGPAFVVIPAGLAILATEFAWAKWMLKRARERTSSLYEAVFAGTRWSRIKATHTGACRDTGEGAAGAPPLPPLKPTAAERSGA